MLAFVGLLILAGIACLIAGLINPAIVKQPTRKQAFFIFSSFGFAFIAFSGIIGCDSNNAGKSGVTISQTHVAAKRETPPNEQIKIVTQNNWFEGGTLHKKGILDWQKASHADKLATCGDFVSLMSNDGALNAGIRSKLTSVDAVRPYAEELVDFIDLSTKKETDQKKNEMLYTNQTVAGMAVIGMAMMGWTK